jgi:hypothetical protein
MRSQAGSARNPHIQLLARVQIKSFSQNVKEFLKDRDLKYGSAKC